MARDQVFISYSHADSEWLNRLQTILIPLQRRGTLKVWADTDIRPGQRWKEEIKQALAKAAVAVLLVSPDFLASRFIHEHELPPLLDAATKEGLTLLWVPVRPSLYEETVIGEYQAAYDPKTPLSTLPVWQQEVALTEIARTIKLPQPTEISSSSPPAQNTNTSAKQTPNIEPELPAKPTCSPLPAIQSIHGWSAHQPPVTPPPHTKVFISYSHKNKEWLEQLKRHLKPLVREGQLDCWDDTHIRPGDDWQQEIRTALDTAQLAVLLISADFFASDLIDENELPPLLTAAQAKGVRILPVILSASRFARHPDLARFQAVNPPERPLDRMSPAEQEEVFDRLAQIIESALDPR